MYKCSECARTIGPQLDSAGKPELFKCHRTGNVAHTIPRLPQGRKPPGRNKSLTVEDNSPVARKRKRQTVQSNLPWDD